MVEERCADTESPREHLKGACAELRVVCLKEVSEPRNAETEKNWGHDVVPLKEAELWELHEIFYKLPTGLNELCTQYPSNVRPPHAVDAWWMYILFGVRELVVMTVM